MPARRWLVIGLCLAAAATAGAFIAYRLALNELRAQVLSALGPASEIGEIDLSFRAIRITSLGIKAPPGWPAKYALHAGRVVLVPELSALLTGAVVISSIHVDHASLAVLRDRNGKIHVLPGLTERKAAAAGKSATDSATATKVLIGEVVLQDSAISFFDAEVRSPPLEVKLENVNARVTRLRMPDLTEKSDLTLAASIKGPAHAGTVAMTGWMRFASKDSELATRVRGVDIVSLEPYLIRNAETGVNKGILDLDLNATIAARQIRAPGVLKLKDLELRSDGASGVGTFMGMPRESFIAMLRERDGSISIPFNIQGNMNDPNFALDNAFKARVGLAAATTLGITVKGLIDAFSTRKDASGESASKADKVLDALKGLFRK